jgi:hypothetical protein
MTLQLYGTRDAGNPNEMKRFVIAAAGAAVLAAGAAVAQPAMPVEGDAA